MSQDISPQNAFILSQIKSLEAQLGALKAGLLKSAAQDGAPTHTFADLYGRLTDQANSSDADVEAVLYHLPGDFEEAN